MNVSGLLRRVAKVAMLALGLACPAAFADDRVALVIGNGDYKTERLDNPLNDANDIAAALRQAGFKVIVRTNANTRELRQAVREFGTELRRADVGLFYFAGHGMQVTGTNYLLPVAADIQNEADVEDLALDVNYVLRTMEDAQTKMRIVVLDACRNNPFARATRSSMRGLAPMTAASGSFVAFATAPGSVAADGQGRNGIYTKHLLDSLRAPDTEILRVFQRTRANVVRETGGKQTPWEATSLLGEFHFRAPVVVAGAAAGAGPAVDAAVDPGANERAYWESVKDSKRPDELKAYLEQFPNGVFVALARTRLRGLEAPLPQAAPSPSPSTQAATAPAQLAAAPLEPPPQQREHAAATAPSRNSLSYGGVTSQVEKNRTTQLELVQLFGGPSISTTDADGTEVWVYERAVTETERQSRSDGWQAAANLGLFFTAVNIGGGGSTAKSNQSSHTSTSFRSLTVIVKFNPNKTVKEYAVRASQF